MAVSERIYGLSVKCLKIKTMQFLTEYDWETILWMIFILMIPKQRIFLINALRVIFNIISIISNEQFRPQDRPKQLSLFDEEFETENNILLP